MWNMKSGKRSESASLSPFRSSRSFPAALFHPSALALIGLLFLFSGCQGENNTSRPNLPAGVTNISKSADLSIAPHAAASGSTVYVVWQENVGSQNMEVLLSRSADGGATFSPPINVSDSPLFSGNPQVAVSGNFVYVVWEETASADTAQNNDLDIFYRRGQDENGTFTWYPPLNEPGLTLSNPNHICKNNNSATPGSDPCPSQLPAIAASGSNVFVVWAESTVYQFKLINTTTPPSKDFQIINSDILMVRSTDNGQQFDSPLVLSGPKSQSTLSPSFNPALAATSDHVYIAWEDIPQPQPQPFQSKVLFRKLVDPFNLTFDPGLDQQAKVLSGFIKGSSRPALAAEGDRVYLAWEGFLPKSSDPKVTTPVCPAVQGYDPLSTTEILLIRSDNQGDQFTDPNDCAQSNFSNTPGSSNGARIATSGAFVDVAWMDSTPGLAGILVRRSADSGATFSAPSPLSEGGSTANPAIAASDGTLFAFWEDATLGHLDIVFSKK